MKYCIVKDNKSIYYCIPTFMKITFYELLCNIYKDNYSEIFENIFKECQIDFENFIINDYVYINKQKERVI